MTTRIRIRDEGGNYQELTVIEPKTLSSILLDFSVGMLIVGFIILIIL